jgi:hypothetical protein
MKTQDQSSVSILPVNLSDELVTLWAFLNKPRICHYCSTDLGKQNYLLPRALVRVTHAEAVVTRANELGEENIINQRLGQTKFLSLENKFSEIMHWIHSKGAASFISNGLSQMCLAEWSLG